MLRKLLKYDFKTFFQTLLPVYGIGLLLSIISNISIRVSDLTPIFRVPMTFIIGLSILVSIGTVFITFVVGIINFYKQTVKDEGYLLHTLPVSKDCIIFSKLISLISMEILSLIVSIITFLITIKVEPSQILDGLKSILDVVGDYKLTVLLVTITVIVGQIVNILLVYLSISFGQRHSTNKLLFSIIYGIVIYNATQILTSMVYLPILSNEKVVEALDQTIPEAQILNVMFLMTLIFSLIIGIVYYILTKKNLETKLNLE